MIKFYFSLIFLLFNYEVFCQEKNPDNLYSCPPCNLPCDDSIFQKPGICPYCKMTLVKTSSLNKSYETTMNVCFYLQDGVEILDFAGPMEVFAIAGFNVFTVSKTKQTITSQGILKITPDFSIEEAPAYDMLAVFGGNAGTAYNDPNVIDWIKRGIMNTKYYFAVCTGAFILGKAGLLDSLTATTFHLSIEDLKKQFPATTVLSGMRFVDNGSVITTAGISAGIDGALYLVEKLKGKEEARRIAQLMEYDKWIPGEGLIIKAKRDSIKKPQNAPWLVEAPVDSLAEPVKRLDGTRISADSLTSAITKLMMNAKVHGLSVTVFNDNKIVYKKAFGYKRFDFKQRLQTNTNFYGASLSKAVFSVLVMKLVEEGVLNLDKPLQSYLPKPVYEYGPGKSWNQDYTSLKYDSLYQKITARMCLSNTSGFPNWRSDEPDEKLRVKFIPGAHYSYSGEGFCYLQFVIEKITGKSLETLMEEKIFNKLGMHSSAYTWKEAYENNYSFGHSSKGTVFAKDKDNAARSASTLETTPDDYSLFLEAVLQKKILKSSSYKQMFSPVLFLHTKVQMAPESWKNITTEFDHLKLAYGLGWGLLQTPFGMGAFKEGHGEGFQHYSILFPSKGTGILIMSNSDNAEKIFKELLEVAIKDVYTPWKWQQYIPYEKNIN